MSGIQVTLCMELKERPCGMLLSPEGEIHESLKKQVTVRANQASLLQLTMIISSGGASRGQYLKTTHWPWRS
ncbi:hypothetical protein GN956_G7355 [Arapaima gigas]